MIQFSTGSENQHGSGGGRGCDVNAFVSYLPFEHLPLTKSLHSPADNCCQMCMVCYGWTEETSSGIQWTVSTVIRITSALLLVCRETLHYSYPQKSALMSFWINIFLASGRAGFLQDWDTFRFTIHSPWLPMSYNLAFHSLWHIDILTCTHLKDY